MIKSTSDTNENSSIKTFAIPFVILTYCISWSIWIAIIIAMKCDILTYGSPVMMMFNGLAITSPAIVSIILKLRSKQMTKKELFRDIFNFKQPILTYAIVFVVALLMYLIPLAMNRATIVGPLYFIILLIPLELVGGGFEEIGWRYLLQPTLEKKSNFIISTIITAIIWAVWHIPLFFMKGTNQYSWNFGIFTIWVLGMAFILSALFKTTNCVLPCILFHALTNSTGDAIAINMDLATTSIISIVLIIISIIILKNSKKEN